MCSKTVPADFRKFVHYIETSQQIYINLSWSSIEEFRDCIAYYFERAISNLEWSRRFADRAAKLSLLRALSPDNALRKINFKDVLLKESKKRLEEFYQKLESDDSYTLDQAIRLVKFIGELFNVEILSLEFLKRQMEILEARIASCSKSSRCYFLLIGVVKPTVQTMSEINYSFTAKNLLKTIEDAENRFISPRTPKATPPSLSPSSEKSFTRFQTPTVTNDNNEQLERFKRLLEDLTPTNLADVIKKIEKDHQNMVKGGSWQIYYDVMMEKALTKHKLAEAVINLCQKIASIGPGIKNGDYRKHLFAYINKSIEKLFERSEEDAQNRIFGVAHFVEKMIEQSLCSIGTISSFIEVILSNKSKNDALASKILMQMLFGIKSKTNCEKIRKLPESTRLTCVQLITSKLSEDPKYGKHVGIFEEYLLGRKSEPSPHVRAQNIPTNSVTQESMTVLKQFKGFSSIQILPPAMPSSPNVKQQSIQEDFDFSHFIDNLSFNNVDLNRKTVRDSSIHPGWDLNKLAETMFDKALQGGQHATYIKFGMIINEENLSSLPTFEENLRRVAVKALSKELATSNAETDKTALSTAKFLSELYMVGWLSNELFLLCLDRIAADEFESLRRIKMFLSIVKPAAMKLIKNKTNDSFIYYLQLIRVKASKTPPSNHQWICLELVELLESITAMRQNSMPAPVVQQASPPSSPPESNKFDTIIEVITNVNFNEIEDCVKTIKLMNIRKAEEVTCLAVTVVQQSLAAQDLTTEYAKLIQQLTELQFNIGNVPANVFKILLINAYQQKFQKSLPVDSSRATEVYCLVQLIAEIYKVNIVDHKFIENCMVSFLCFEPSCEFTVRCISQLLTAVGEMFESQREDVLNTYFCYFKRIVEKETSFRASVYQELLTLRKNKWNVVVEIPKRIQLSPGSSSSSQHLDSSTPSSPVASTSSQSVTTTAQPPVATTPPPLPIASTSRAESPAQPTTQMTTMVIDFQELISSIELKNVAHVLKQHLKSASQVKGLVTAILGHPFNNFNEISSCVNLFKTLADIEVSTKSGPQITFRECLLEVFNVELMNTRASSFDQKKDNAKAAFGNMIVMVGELYKNDLYSDDDLDIWLCNKNLSFVAVEILAHFSSVISQKILNHGRDLTMSLLKFLEKTIQNLTIKACNSMKNDINEVDGLFRRVMNSKFDNED